MITDDVVALAGRAWTVEGGRGSKMEEPEDQWSCKRSPETRDIYQKPCLTRMVIYMNITPGPGQSYPWSQFHFENIKLQSICQFTKSFALQMTF